MVDVLFLLLVMVGRGSSGWSSVGGDWSWLGVWLGTGCSGCSSSNVSVILKVPMLLKFDRSSSLSKLLITSSASMSMMLG